LDRVTGIKQLRVRGHIAVSHAVIGKACGWNILQAARAKTKAARAARKGGIEKVGAVLQSAWQKLSALMRASLLASTTRIHALVCPDPAAQH